MHTTVAAFSHHFTQSLCFHMNSSATYVMTVIMEPLTGRRHQLRVHCHSLGHTILGDYTYSDRSDTKPNRMYLHAYKIQLPNSIEGPFYRPFVIS